MDALKFFRRAVEPTLADIVAWTGAKPRGRRSDRRKSTTWRRSTGRGPATWSFSRSAISRAIERDARTAGLIGEMPRPGPQPGSWRWWSPTLSGLRHWSAPDLSRGDKARVAVWRHGVRPALMSTTGAARSDVTVDPGVVIGPRAEIGAGPVIGPNAVIGPDVRIGRHSVIGAGATVCNALLGDRVIIHPGVRIGQDGFRLRHGPRAISKCRKSAASSSRTKSRSGPTPPSIAARTATPSSARARK